MVFLCSMVIFIKCDTYTQIKCLLFMYDLRFNILKNYGAENDELNEQIVE